MKALVFALLTSLLFTTPALAQGTPGSGTPSPCAATVTTVTANTPFLVCADQDGQLVQSYCVEAVNQAVPDDLTTPRELGSAGPVIVCSDFSTAFVPPGEVRVRVTAGLPVGVYRVTMRAVGFSGTSESTAATLTVVDTLPTTPPPPSAPKNLRFIAGAVLNRTPTGLGFPLLLYPHLLWDDVQGAVAYEVSLTWSSGRLILDRLPVLGSTGVPLPLGMPGHQYQAMVRACSVVPPLSVPCDGAPSLLMVER